MNCPHHLMWIVPVRHGLHQCIQCWQVVGRKDVASKFEDLPPAFQRRWEEHEKEGQPDPAVAPAPRTAAPPAAVAAVPKAPAPPAATPTPKTPTPATPSALAGESEP